MNATCVWIARASRAAAISALPTNDRFAAVFVAQRLGQPQAGVDGGSGVQSAAPRKQHNGRLRTNRGELCD